MLCKAKSGEYIINPSTKDIAKAEDVGISFKAPLVGNERYKQIDSKNKVFFKEFLSHVYNSIVENENNPVGIRLPKSSLVAPKNIIHTEPTIAEVADFPFNGSINAKSISRAERNVGARGRLNTEENGYNKIEELLNRVRELGTDAQGKNPNA